MKLDIKAEAEYRHMGVDPKGYSYDIEGVPNGSADLVKRIDEVWSDGNLHEDFSKRERTFSRLICRHCGGVKFEVLRTDAYETSARCECGFYYIVHNG